MMGKRLRIPYNWHYSRPLFSPATKISPCGRHCPPIRSSPINVIIGFASFSYTRPKLDYPDLLPLTAQQVGAFSVLRTGATRIPSDDIRWPLFPPAPAGRAQSFQDDSPGQLDTHRKNCFRPFGSRFQQELARICEEERPAKAQRMDEEAKRSKTADLDDMKTKAQLAKEKAA